MKRAWISIAGAALLVGGLVAFVAVYFGGAGVAYESPDYRVTETLGGVEIREYAPYLVAETTVDGTIESAGNEGFRRLAKYIFGGNRGAAKVAMTTPVVQEKAAGTKIAMTAPVTQSQSGDQFVVRFMMPSQYSKDTLPEPNDARVAIEEVPARTLAAIRYSGTWSKRNYEKNLATLQSELRSAGLEPIGEPLWARYNPPFTPWFMRRNEILTEFRPASAAH